MDEVTLSLPSALVAGLARDHLVTEPIVWRGADVVSLITLAADVTSAITAVVATRQSFAAIARSLVHHASTEAGTSAEVSISVAAPQGSYVLVERNDQAGLQRLTARVNAVLQDVAAEAEGTASRPDNGEATAV